MTTAPISKNQYLALRTFAGIIDGVVYMLLSILLLTVSIAFSENFAQEFALIFNEEMILGNELATLWVEGALLCLFAWLETNHKQASFGKIALGLKVINLKGEAVKLKYIVIRLLLLWELWLVGLFFFALSPDVNSSTILPDWIGIMPAFLLMLLFMLSIPFGKDYQGLHDRLTGCLVIYKSKPVLGQENLWEMLKAEFIEEDTTEEPKPLPSWALNPVSFRLRRIFAGLVDSFIVLLLIFCLMAVLLLFFDFFPALRTLITPEQYLTNYELEAEVELFSELIIFPFCMTLAPWVYFTLVESKYRDAGLGKRLFSLQITTLDGGPPSIGQAFLRYFFLGGLLFLTLSYTNLDIPSRMLVFIEEGVYLGLFIYLLINIFMIVLANKGFHDLLSGTRVVERANTSITTATTNIEETKVKL